MELNIRNCGAFCQVQTNGPGNLHVCHLEEGRISFFPGIQVLFVIETQSSLWFSKFMNESRKQIEIQDKKFELRITKSEVPILRAGSGNTWIVISFISGCMVNAVLSDYSFSLVLRMIFTPIPSAFFLFLYSRSLVKMLVTDDSMILILPIWSTRINLKTIEYFHVYGLVSSQYIVLKIKQTTRDYPRYFHFVAVNTSLGSYSSTKLKLEQMVKENFT